MIVCIVRPNIKQGDTLTICGEPAEFVYVDLRMPQCGGHAADTRGHIEHVGHPVEVHLVPLADWTGDLVQ